MQTVTIHDKPLAVRRRAALIGVAIFSLYAGSLIRPITLREP